MKPNKNGVNIAETADIYAGGRLVSVLKGGYNPEMLAQSVGTQLAALLDRETKRHGDRSDTSEHGAGAP